MKLIKAQNFEKRILMCWRGPANHNWRRISRALRCLGLSGLVEEQQVLLSCLEAIIVEHPGLIEEVSIGRWLEEGCVKSKLVHTVNPGYITGMLHSPNLLASLCKQYFHKYDTNSDGELCLEEITNLVRDLHRTVGLPVDTITEKQLMDSMVPFSESYRLTEEVFHTWFKTELEYTVARSEQLKVLSEQEVQVIRRNSQDRPSRITSRSMSQDLGEPGRARSKDGHLTFCREVRPEYLKALAESETLLKIVCEKYFKAYDRDINGMLDVQEAWRLVSDLNERLGLTEEAFGMEYLEYLQESLPAHSASRNSSVTAEEFPAWFQGSLRRMIERTATPMETN